MIIHPEIYVTPDLPTIRFREPRDQIDLDEELPKILHTQGWGCGTYFHVQFINHEKTELLASVRYVVTQEIEASHTSDANPYQPVTRIVFSRKAERIGEWWYSSLEKARILIAKGSEGKVVWNPGKKLHQLKIGDEVVFEDRDKKLVEEAAKKAA